MRLLTALYALAIFLSAFLLFLIEPMMGKRLLPLLGGSAAVWTTCLVFFQFALLAGYLYAHRLATRLNPRLQAGVHVSLLVGSLALFYWSSRATVHADTASPVRSVFWLLAFMVGAPFLALSATSPLLQAWYSESHAQKRGKAAPPYHLFALSNFGSLLALVTYPILIEPRFSLRTQIAAWTMAFAVFALACGGIAWQRRGAAPTLPGRFGPHRPLPPPPRTADKALWLLLPACSSLLLCAVTNHITQNIAAIPLLWILPLIMYLLSFVLGFSSWNFYSRRVTLVALAIALVVTAWLLLDIDSGLQIWKAVPFFCGVLLLVCLFCHAELYHLRPDPSYATSFYLCLAVGSALGAFFAGVLAPLIFSADYEFAGGLALVAFLAAAVTRGTKTIARRPTFYLAFVPIIASLASLLYLGIQLAAFYGLRSELSFSVACVFVLIAALAAVAAWTQGTWQQAFWLAGTVAMLVVLLARAHAYAENRVRQMRSFYGVLRVTAEVDENDLYARHLYSGIIEHGKQYDDLEYRGMPTTYYAKDSGAGIALRFCCGDRPRRIGVIGLGAGTLAAYGRRGDLFRFYDINPQVEKIARTDFTYLADSAAEIQIALGDARVSLTHEPRQNFDVLIVDAFSGDAIPVHLLTTQALDIYRAHLRPGGIIAFHVTNRYLDLVPLAQKLAEHQGMGGVHIESFDNDKVGEYGADWVLVTDDRDFLALPEVKPAKSDNKVSDNLRLWTDDYNSLLPLLKSSKSTSDK